MTSPNGDGDYMRHVDLVRNDYAKGMQVRFGRVQSLGHDIKLECEDSNIERVLAEPLYDPRADRFVSREAGDEFLDVLSRTWDGTYLLASSAHEDESCPFVEHDELPFDTGQPSTST